MKKFVAFLIILSTIFLYFVGEASNFSFLIKNKGEAAPAGIDVAGFIVKKANDIVKNQNIAPSLSQKLISGNEPVQRQNSLSPKEIINDAGNKIKDLAANITDNLKNLAAEKITSQICPQK